MIRVFFFALFFAFSLAGCPSDTIYNSISNKCYKFVNQSLSFLAAEQFCQGLGGHLVAISNGFEASTILVDVIGTPQSLSYWIGANYLLAPNWSWTSNTPFNYSNWAPGQPADPSSTQCGAVRNPDNYWTKELCYSRKPFVCSSDPNAVVSPTCQPAPVSTTISPNCPEPTGNPSCSGTCPTDFTMSPIDCKCYYWPSGNGMAYNESITYCQARGANLATITTSPQNQWIAVWITETASLRGYGIYYYYPWIGLSCYGSTPISCHWADGSSLGSYTNFETLYTDEDLAHFNGKNGQFFMRISTSANDFGQWCRYEPDSFGPISVLCMRNPL